MSHVACSICLSVCVLIRRRYPAKSWIDRSALFELADLGGPKKTCIRWDLDPPREGTILLCCPAHWKSLGSLCCGVCSKRDHSIGNNGTTCDAAFCYNFLTTCPRSRPSSVGAYLHDLWRFVSCVCAVNGSERYRTRSSRGFGPILEEPSLSDPFVARAQSRWPGATPPSERGSQVNDDIISVTETHSISFVHMRQVQVRYVVV